MNTPQTPPQATSQFHFLRPEWPKLHSAITKAETLAIPDPRTACFYSRRALETHIQWLFDYDDRLTQPSKTDLSGLLFEPSLKRLLGEVLHSKCDYIRKLGNLAVHSNKPITPQDAIAALQELFHLTHWLTRNYTQNSTSKPTTRFNPSLLPKTTTPPQTLQQLQTLETQLANKDEALTLANRTNAQLTTELETLRTQIAATVKITTTQSDTHDYNEAQTRDRLIDLLLKEAGWPLDHKNDREYPVTGMPTPSGKGFVCRRTLTMHLATVKVNCE